MMRNIISVRHGTSHAEEEEEEDNMPASLHSGLLLLGAKYLLFNVN